MRAEEDRWGVGLCAAIQELTDDQGSQGARQTQATGTGSKAACSGLDQMMDSWPAPCRL